MKYFTEIIKRLKSHPTYIYYSLGYGLSSLIIPLGVQFLVNSLALSGIWLNTTTFIFFIVMGLVVSNAIKHSQLILLEYLQREIFCLEISKWRHVKIKNYSHYYFETMDLLKSFSKSYSNLIELGLITFFGLLTIVFFHPAFLIILILISATLFQIFKSSAPAIFSSLKESDKKYEIFDKIQAEAEVLETDIADFLSARDNHFSFVRRNSFKIAALIVIVQALLLFIGAYLIKINQLSIGQLVSAEIIISGISISMMKLPLTLEAVYDFETSKIKIKKALSQVKE